YHSASAHSPRSGRSMRRQLRDGMMPMVANRRIAMRVLGPMAALALLAGCAGLGEEDQKMVSDTRAAAQSAQAEAAAARREAAEARAIAQRAAQSAEQSAQAAQQAAARAEEANERANRMFSRSLRK